MTLADRMQKALDHRAQSAAPGEVISKSGLARACGIKQPSVSAWFSGATKTLEGANLLKAAEYLKVNPIWLSGQRAPMLLKEDGSYASSTVVCTEKVVPISEQSRWPFTTASWDAYRRLHPDDKIDLDRRVGKLMAAYAAGDPGSPSVRRKRVSRQA